ncbi:hypothetical protein HS088_TW01G00393 [Tripterygium wilfordii]|uniref:Uncharacterized protein n=1 Tax=Tripterygium wilfordii TaxID=458696 RepID=A0A7J7E1D4_TRIWF|nr:uncharacterized protein LOC119998871 [Tripterygium wilfordii]KAF5752482.1 hypothetical protein HS088_TW01G00393 [Tripterygium wilfordii]
MKFLLRIRIRTLSTWPNRDGGEHTMLSYKLFPRRSSNATQRRNQKEKISKGKLKARIKRLRAEMVEIGEEQKRIREGKRQVRNKYQELKAEQEQLKMETNLISQHSLSIQQRLILLFKIFKAKVDNDFAKAAQLSQSLCDLIANQNVAK